MPNPSADYPLAIHTATDVSVNAASTLGGTTPTHTQLEGKQEAELAAVQTKLGIGASPASTAATNNVLKKQSDGTTTWDSIDYSEIDNVPTVLGTFIDLPDTPATYTGQAGKAVRVTATEDAVEFYTPEVGDITAVVAGAGMSGGGTTGSVTLTNADRGSTAVATHEAAYTHTDIALNTAKRHDAATPGAGISVAGQVITNSDRGSTAVSTHEGTYDHTLLHAAATAGAGISITGQQITNSDRGSVVLAQHLLDYDHGDIAHSNRASLDLVSGTNTGDQNASGVSIADSGNYFTGTTVEAALQEIGAGTTLDGTYLKRSNNLSDLNNAGTARTNLGLGSLAVLNSIDISDNTNLAVSSPITLTGDTVGINQSLLSITASQVSDFDTEVANNSAVTANTAKISADGSVNTHSDVDTVSTTPARDQVLKWNGTNWVPADPNATFEMSIASFTDNATDTQEIGSGTWLSAGEIAFSATYNNGPPSSATVQLVSPPTGVSAWGTPLSMGSPTFAGPTTNTDTVAYPTSKDTTVTFRLSATLSPDSDTADTTVTFRNNIFWGVATINSGFTEADVEALANSELSNDQTRTMSINSGSGQYLVFAFPSSYTSIPAGSDYETNGNSGFIFNSISCAFNSAETVSITNASGFTENYKVYASTNANLGNSSLVTTTSSSTINRLYYGVSTVTSGFTESNIESLSTSTVTNDNTQVWSEITAGSGQYLVFAFPKRLGTVVFYVGGFEGGFESPETVSVTNINGWTEDYYVWRSTNSNLGATTVETRSS